MMKKKITRTELNQLVGYLNGLHQNSEDGGWWWVGKYGTANIKLWAYFEYPFKEENGFNLDDIQDGLQELALPYKKDVELKTLSD
jgi:5-methylthioribose kinase